MRRQDTGPQWLGNATRVMALPMQLVASTAIGYLFGSWLDGKFGTDPWLMLLFTLMGIVGGFIEIIRAAIRMSKDE